MKETTQPVLNIFAGHAGSGKSYFARKLAEEKSWVRLNGDTLRIALFGSVEAAHAQDISVRREGVFKAIDYVVEQVLNSGQSVVYDANCNRRSIRESHEALAIKCGALPVTIMIQTPKDLAIERVQQREELIDQRKMSEKQAIETIERHIANFDAPTKDENVIMLDGTQDFEIQLKSYNDQLKEFYG